MTKRASIPSLFAPYQPDPIPAIDPNVRVSDAKRLSGQNAAILARLRRGPATNVELAALSLKYTSRVSDMRAAGYSIKCTFGPGGVNTYQLEQ
jgi:hypothetical protein